MNKCNGMLLFMLAFVVRSIYAEPYIAVREGLDCNACHVNPTGGGLRNVYGKLFGQSQLPAYRLSEKEQPVWTGEVLDRFLVGGNARYSSREFDNDEQDDSANFGVDRVSLYLSGSLNSRVSFLIDQQVSPGGSLNRESWVKLRFNNVYLKAGKLFLPFGWRLEDDTAFSRELTGINFNNADNGIELGLVHEKWSFQLTASNGTAGSAEVDDGKQISTRGAFVSKNWQLGFSANTNHTDLGDREMYGLFAGLNTGPVTWLIEWDHVKDKGFTTNNGEQDIGLLEANWRVAKGHNLKASFDKQHFDDWREDRLRYSLVWEFFPISFTQIRAGIRKRDSDEDNTLLNSEEVFGQIHVYF
jgi:Phosphate-selective porin O and P